LAATVADYGLSAPCGEERHGVFCGEVMPVPFAGVTVQQPAQLVGGALGKRPPPHWKRLQENALRLSKGL